MHVCILHNRIEMADTMASKKESSAEYGLITLHFKDVF